MPPRPICSTTLTFLFQSWVDPTVGSSTTGGGTMLSPLPRGGALVVGGRSDVPVGTGIGRRSCSVIGEGRAARSRGARRCNMLPNLYRDRKGAESRHRLAAIRANRSSPSRRIGRRWRERDLAGADLGAVPHEARCRRDAN